MSDGLFIKNKKKLKCEVEERVGTFFFKEERVSKMWMLLSVCLDSL